MLLPHHKALHNEQWFNNKLLMMQFLLSLFLGESHYFISLVTLTLQWDILTPRNVFHGLSNY